LLFAPYQEPAAVQVAAVVVADIVAVEADIDIGIVVVAAVAADNNTGIDPAAVVVVEADTDIAAAVVAAAADNIGIAHFEQEQLWKDRLLN